MKYTDKFIRPYFSSVFVRWRQFNSLCYTITIVELEKALQCIRNPRAESASLYIDISFMTENDRCNYQGRLYEKKLKSMFIIK